MRNPDYRHGVEARAKRRDTPNDPLDCDWIPRHAYCLARRSKRYRRRIEACCDREVIRPWSGKGGTLNWCAHPRLKLRNFTFRMAHYAHVSFRRPGTLGYLDLGREDPPETFAQAKPHVYTAEELCEMYERAPERPKDPVYICSPTELSKLKAWYRHNVSEQAEQVR